MIYKETQRALQGKPHLLPRQKRVRHIGAFSREEHKIDKIDIMEGSHR